MSNNSLTIIIKKTNKSYKKKKKKVKSIKLFPKKKKKKSINMVAHDAKTLLTTEKKKNGWLSIEKVSMKVVKASRNIFSNYL